MRRFLMILGLVYLGAWFKWALDIVLLGIVRLLIASGAIVLLLVLGLASPGWAANTLVQSCTAYNGGSGTTVACTLPGSVAAGNTLAVCVYTFAGSLASVTSVAGNSNTYTGTDTADSGTSTLTTLYAKNVNSGSTTVTATLSISVPATINVHEVAGPSTSSPLDGNAINVQIAAGTGTDAITSGPVTTTSNGDYIFGCFADAAVVATFTAGTGFTNVDLNGQVVGTEYLIQGSAGSISATATASGSVTTIAAIMAFKTAAAGGGMRHRVITQ